MGVSVGGRVEEYQSVWTNEGAGSFAARAIREKADVVSTDHR